MERRSLTNYAKLLLRRNTELRLENIQLEADLRAQQAESQRWINKTIAWKQEAANWQQTALAAIAKAEAMERR